MLPQNHRSEAKEREATQDDPESGSEAPVIRVRGGVPSGAAVAGAGGRGAPAGEDPGTLLGLWTPGTGLRHAAGTAFEFVPLWGMAVFFLYVPTVNYFLISCCLIGKCYQRCEVRNRSSSSRVHA
jgi:hypothetical protein